MKNKLIIGNMKMNLDKNEIDDYLKKISSIDNPNVVLCPSSIYIPYFLNHGFSLGIQNIFSIDKGAYTGEISSWQAASLGVEYAIVGHSERRNILYETDDFIHEKVKQGLKNKIKVVLCVGEKKGEDYLAVLEKQVTEALKEITDLENVIIAYEPVWAIGTNEIPSSEAIKKATIHIKRIIKNKYSCDIRVLYGGSINTKNIEELNRIEEVDGFLVGGSSLKPDDFIKIIEVTVKG